MMRHCYSVTIWLTLAASTTNLSAAEVLFYEKDGTTFKETRTVTKIPVNDVKIEEQVKTVYTERFTTEMQQKYRTVYTPVTEYRWMPRVHGAWNPLVPNHVAYHLVPHTYWKPTRQSYQVPVTHHDVVPEQRIVRVKRPVLRFDERIVIDRVAMPNAPQVTPSLEGKSRTSIANRPRFGGVEKVDDSLRKSNTVRR